MSEPTFHALACPHCHSFVPEGAAVCPVCKKPLGGGAGAPAPHGQAPAPNKTAGPPGPTKRAPRSDETVCGACGAFNDAAAIYCKACGAKLGVAAPKRGGGRAALSLEWSTALARNSLPREIALQPLQGFSLLAGSLQGLEVLVSACALNRPPVIFSASHEAKARFYLRLERPLVIESGATFYLGMAALELRGSLGKAASAPPTFKGDSTTDVTSTAPLTMLAGPGEEPGGAALTGPPTLILPNPPGARPIGPIESAVELSRSWLERMSGASGLNMYGVSEHSPVRLAPVGGPFWLLEATGGGAFYLPIGEKPVTALEGDVLRMVEDKNASEARFSVIIG